MTILQQLRDETSEQHAALETRLPLFNPGFTVEAYRLLLARFLGYYAPLEDRLLAAGPSAFPLEAHFDYSERVKTPRIERDLAALGAPPGAILQLPRCSRLPDLSSASRRLGCLYVIEGATLGGQVITRHLASKLGLSPECGLSFFNGRGPETGPLWRAFGQFLVEAASRLNDNESIAAAARETFATLDQWLFPSNPPAPDAAGVSLPAQRASFPPPQPIHAHE